MTTTILLPGLLCDDGSAVIGIFCIPEAAGASCARSGIAFESGQTLLADGFKAHRIMERMT